MKEREMLIRAYDGIEKIPVKDFAIMVGKSYNTVRRNFANQIRKDESGGYFVFRVLNFK